MHCESWTAERILHEFYKWIKKEEQVLCLDLYQQALAESTVLLPEEYCMELGFPAGTTVGHALRSMFAFWIDGVEHRIDTRIGFPSEEESLRWWKATADMERVTLTCIEGQEWELKVARPNP